MSNPASIEILQGLRDICLQYEQEISTPRRPWPKTIKSKVFELRQHGVSYEEIAKVTGISKQTMYSWHAKIKAQKNTSFLPVRIVPGATSPLGAARRATVQPPQLKRDLKMAADDSKAGAGSTDNSTVSSTVTVVKLTKLGVEIEGLSANEVLQLVGQMLR